MTANPAPNAAPASESAPSSLIIEDGVCVAMFAYDVGQHIDLNAVERIVGGQSQRRGLKKRRGSPRHFEFDPAPITLTQDIESIEVAGRALEPQADLTLYDFGAVTLAYRIDLRGPLGALVDIGVELYENAALLASSRKQVEAMMAILAPAVRKGHVAEFVEDYCVYQILALRDHPLERAVRSGGGIFAMALRADREPLSDQAQADVLGSRLSFGQDDTAIVDWNGAILLDADSDDGLAVLAYANVELLEMRYLDHQLDRALEIAWEATQARGWTAFLPGAGAAEQRRVAEFQIDGALLFEGVNNAVKLLGDQYLARLYRLASDRLHLPDWDASIMRKLDALDRMYQKITDQRAAWRMEALEWVIIVLIAVSIILPLMGLK
ncbi:MAG: hypothetical protein KDA32_12040 [Phycisphaerales bacterium]|nr:hypothetical protein [Phycisphaerales bacterium]